MALRESSLALYNNLSVLPLPDRRLTYFACVHGSSATMVSAAADGLSASQRQLQASEGGLGVGTSIVTQVARGGAGPPGRVLEAAWLQA